jgi:small subunit ribosomal protein S13
MSEKLLKRTGIDPNIKGKDISENDILKLREALKDISVEGDLRKEISMHIKRLMDIGSYRGMRHRKGLPARGQRTRTNARTRRGKRKTVGSGRKKEEKT